MQPSSHKWLQKTLELAVDLINCPSFEPHDGGAQDLVARYLKAAGFTVTRLEVNAVQSLWAESGKQGPLFAFLGHSDVVPAGEPDLWDSDPFCARVQGGNLYGRGACDMKGALSAFITAAEHFVSLHRDESFPYRLGILISADEEREEPHGTQDVLTLLKSENKHIDYCLVGEPTSAHCLGDTIKLGRRGSLNGHFKIIGKAGHSAYPHQAVNPITQAVKALSELSSLSFDSGNVDFPPTALQLTGLRAGTSAANLIPGQAEGSFNIRFSDCLSKEEVCRRSEEVFKKHALTYELRWSLTAKPYLSKRGLLTNLLIDTLQDELHITPQITTDGGTSDGRFVAVGGTEVVEFGLPNQTIHQANECTAVSDLFALARVYCALLKNLAGVLPPSGG